MRCVFKYQLFLLVLQFWIIKIINWLCLDLWLPRFSVLERCHFSWLTWVQKLLLLFHCHFHSRSLLFWFQIHWSFYLNPLYFVQPFISAFLNLFRQNNISCNSDSSGVSKKLVAWLWNFLFSGQLPRLLGSMQFFQVAFLKVTKGIFCLSRIYDCVKAKYELEAMTWKSVPDFEAVFYLLTGWNSVQNLRIFSLPTPIQIPSCSVKMELVFIDFQKPEGFLFSHAYFGK